MRRSNSTESQIVAALHEGEGGVPIAEVIWEDKAASPATYNSRLYTQAVSTESTSSVIQNPLSTETARRAIHAAKRKPIPH